MRGDTNDEIFKGCFQRTAYQLILDKEAPNELERIRHMLQKRKLWNVNRFPTPPNTGVLQSTPNSGARRALGNLRAMKAATTPRVQSAVFSTIWNRWTTHRRFQKRSAATNRCMLGCPAPAEDAIEHYCCCPITRRLMRQRLNVDVNNFSNFHTYMMTNVNITDKALLCKIGLLVYAVYNTTNCIRNSVKLIGEEARYDCLCQNLREGAKGHKFSMEVLDGAFR